MDAAPQLPPAAVAGRPPPHGTDPAATRTAVADPKEAAAVGARGGRAVGTCRRADGEMGAPLEQGWPVAGRIKLVARPQTTQSSVGA